MSEIEKAIQVYETEKECMNRTCSDCQGECLIESPAIPYGEALEIALGALREKAEREKGCEWCTTVDSATAYRRFYRNLFKGSDLVCIAQSVKHLDKFYLHVEMDEGGDGDCEITICPVCGRKLVP